MFSLIRIGPPTLEGRRHGLVSVRTAIYSHHLLSLAVCVPTSMGKRIFALKWCRLHSGKGLPSLLPRPGILTDLRQIIARNGIELNRLFASDFLRHDPPNCLLMAFGPPLQVVSNRECRTSLRSGSSIII
jgi:hypothetical protein